MIKERATVISWKDGIALVSCNIQTLSCHSCMTRSHCNSRILNNINLNMNSRVVGNISVLSEQPLIVGQQIEIGITKGSLVKLLMLIYFLPLLGSFIVGGLLNLLFINDLAAMSGIILGGFIGFLVARSLCKIFTERGHWQSVVLNTTLLHNQLHIGISE